MLELKLTFLGTGTSQGVPIIGCKCLVCQSSNFKDKRLRSSVFIEVDGVNIVIDTGPDFRQQMLRESIDKMDAVLFTHEHKDHMAGFDDIRAFNYIQQKAMDVYADRFVKLALQRDFYYAFEENKYPGVPNVNLHLIKNDKFKINDVEIIPVQGLHYMLPVFGFRIKDCTYLTDVNYVTTEEKEKIKGSKVLIVNALRKSDHISHFSLRQAISFGEEIGAKSVYFTHMSHQIGLHNEVENELPHNMHLAYDGLQINL